jgi:virginiamycin B lyase
MDRVGVDGTVTPVAQLGSQSSPIGIVQGGDGNLWVAEAGAIARVTPQGAVTTYRLAVPAAGTLRIVNGTGSDLWFVEQTAGAVGKISLKGTISMLPALVNEPTGIVAGADGHMWVAEEGAGRIDRIDGNTLTPFAVSTQSSAPEDIVAGPQRTLWFTDFHTGQVASFSVDRPATGPS